MPATTEGLVGPRGLDTPTIDEQAIDEHTIDIGATLSWYRHGSYDPTTWLRVVGRGPRSSGEFVRATLTPDGPATVEVSWGIDVGSVESPPAAPCHTDSPEAIRYSVRSYGPGRGWLAARIPAMLGTGDAPPADLESAPDEVVAEAARKHRGRRRGASGDLYHELLPTIIEQRITGGEAHRQWSALCTEFGAPAPGPFAGLRVPPEPSVLARVPSWQLHPLGIERKRAEALSTVARHPGKLWNWSTLAPLDTRAKLQLLPGIGNWTIGSVLGPAVGDPDAVPVGDFHIKNMVSWALAGEPRGTDERMLELLEPYAGHRGRVVQLIGLAGLGAPKFGPKKRILPMRSW